MSGSTPTTTGAARPQTITAPFSRLTGLDIARGIAVLGMFVAHTWPESDTAFSSVLTGLANGERPRTLFAVVGGISLALFVRSLSGRPGFDAARIRRTNAVRGVALVAIGLFLQTMYSGVSIVLDTWGLLFLFFVPLLRVPSRWIVGLAAVALPVGVALELASENWSPLLRLQGSIFVQPLDWLVWGSYPLLIWVCFLGVGFVLGRLDITARRTQLWMTGGGILVAAVAQLVLHLALQQESFGWELATHLSALGVAAAVVGLLCLLTGQAVPRASRIVGIILYPLASVGMMPLTIYVGHVLALALRYALDPSQPVKNATVWLVLTLASLVFATLWRLLFGQGPLERALRAIDGSRRVRPTGIEPMTSTV